MGISAERMPRSKKSGQATDENEILERARRTAETHPFHALKLLQSLIEKNPECINAYIMLGEICISEVISETEDFDAPAVAKDAFQQAINLSGTTPLPASVYFNLASLSEDEEAIKLYQVGIAVATKEVEEASAQGKPRTAKRIKKEIVAAYMSLAELHQSNSTDDEISPAALECFQQAQQILPNSPMISQVKANFLFKRTQAMKQSITPSTPEDTAKSLMESIATMRQEVLQLIEQSVKPWANSIPELMEDGLLFHISFNYFLPSFLFSFFAPFHNIRSKAPPTNITGTAHCGTALDRHPFSEICHQDSTKSIRSG